MARRLYHQIDVISGLLHYSENIKTAINQSVYWTRKVKKHKKGAQTVKVKRENEVVSRVDYCLLDFRKFSNLPEV